MTRRLDLTGERFTRLIVLSEAPNRKGVTMWRCQCDCGEIKDIATRSLRSGDAKSCGCLSREAFAAYNDSRRIESPEGLKHCQTCQTFLPVEEFHRLGSATDGLQPRCKSCARLLWIRAKYGLTRDEYEQLLIAQDYKCAICGSSFADQTPDVDHCHDTGQVRGLLCRKCNTAIGLLDHEVEYARRAMEYLNA